MIANTQDDNGNIAIADSSSSSTGDGMTAFNGEGRTNTSPSIDGDTVKEKKNPGDAIRKNLATNESLKVERVRFLVMIYILGLATSLSISCFRFTSRTEYNAFSDSYLIASQAIFHAIEENFLTRMSSIHYALGVAVTTHAILSDEEWPFVTVPRFHHRGTAARHLSGALLLSLEPIVTDGNRLEWEESYTLANKQWLSEGLRLQHEETGITEIPDPGLLANMTSSRIFYYDAKDDQTRIVATGPGPFLPEWQSSPIVESSINVNQNRFMDGGGSVLKNVSYTDGKAVFGAFEYGPASNAENATRTSAMFATLLSLGANESLDYTGEVFTRLHIPVYDSLEKSTGAKVVGTISALIRWGFYMENVLLPDHSGIHVVVENSCDVSDGISDGVSYTYEVNGANVVGLGVGDLHDPTFDLYERVLFLGSNQTIADGSMTGLPFDNDGCVYKFRIFPSTMFTQAYITTTPVVITFGIALSFAVFVYLFLVFNRLVGRRQKKLLSKVAHSTALVTSLFPKQVQERLLLQGGLNDGDLNTDKVAASHRLKSFLTGDTHTTGIDDTPIADLFPHCTVLFADIAGFTAWSSTRGPEHVFILLQTLYHGFDQLAKNRRVFKVETIGDCYLAVTGLPEPQPNHALLMARFAWEAKHKMMQLTRDLELTLGPDCSELKIRVGLHSGPVTAGVLRGDRARFQLFGDTVNTAARMESTGVPDRIQVSQVTADILSSSGKAHWLSAREDVVEAKGKGGMKTFWLNPGRKRGFSPSENENVSQRCDDTENTPIDISGVERDLVKRERLIDWMVELLREHIMKVVAKTHSSVAQKGSSPSYFQPDGMICLDEVKEMIHLPKLEHVPNSEHRPVELSPTLLSDLRSYVSFIAAMYHNNPFHNFEHACHVTMSVSKLLRRIVTPELCAADMQRVKGDSQGLAAHLHDFTYGIHSDPLAQFAMVFSALIHDVDHRGCSNAQLIKEEESMGHRYRGKSVAEQNSLDLSWSLLMSSQFDQLRSDIFGSQYELLRFRQIIVNTVLATDIFDKELNDLRKLRWTKAFSCTDSENEHSSDLKATIVIEHLIQASDVAHTMQHWHIYRKWNHNLFKEMYAAFAAGRMAVDPTTFWYKGELSFFDNYVIPLAKKLKECNVFGVSSDEYLNYAVCNREEWEQRGEAIIGEMLRELDGVDAGEFTI